MQQMKFMHKRKYAEAMFNTINTNKWLEPLIQKESISAEVIDKV
jgi:hypothetical protein